MAKVLRNKIKTLVNSKTFSTYEVLVVNIRVNSLAAVGDIIEIIKELTP